MIGQSRPENGGEKKRGRDNSELSRMNNCLPESRSPC